MFRAWRMMQQHLLARLPIDRFNPQRPRRRGVAIVFAEFTQPRSCGTDLFRTDFPSHIAPVSLLQTSVGACAMSTDALSPSFHADPGTSVNERSLAVRAEGMHVASSASIPAQTKGALLPVGLRHAYRDGDPQTLCGLAIKYLFPVEKAKWSPKTPLRCAECDVVGAREKTPE